MQQNLISLPLQAVRYGDDVWTPAELLGGRETLQLHASAAGHWKPCVCLDVCASAPVDAIKQTLLDRMVDRSEQ